MAISGANDWCAFPSIILFMWIRLSSWLVMRSRCCALAGDERCVCVNFYSGQKRRTRLSAPATVPSRHHSPSPQFGGVQRQLENRTIGVTVLKEDLARLVDAATLALPQNCALLRKPPGLYIAR